MRIICLVTLCQSREVLILQTENTIAMYGNESPEIFKTHRLLFEVLMGLFNSSLVAQPKHWALGVQLWSEADPPPLHHV